MGRIHNVFILDEGGKVAVSVKVGSIEVADNDLLGGFLVALQKVGEKVFGGEVKDTKIGNYKLFYSTSKDESGQTATIVVVGSENSETHEVSPYLKRLKDLVSGTPHVEQISESNVRALITTNVTAQERISKWAASQE